MPEHLSYFRALCLKKIQNFKEAEKEYKSLHKKFALQEGQRLKKYIFGIIMLPLQKERKVIENYTGNLHELIKLYSPDAGIDRNLQFNLKQVYEQPSKLVNFDGTPIEDDRNEPPKWKYLESAARILKKVDFFKRLPEHIIEKFLPKMRLIEKKHGDLVFTEEGKVLVILNGRTVLRQHDRNPLDHKTLASYTQGSIIGFDQGDEGMTSDCDVWISVASKFIQYVEIELPIFEKLWKFSQTPDQMVRLAVLQQFEFSNRLFLVSLHNIIYDFGKVVTYAKGQLIIPLHRRSFFQPHYKDFYEGRCNKMLDDVEKVLSQPNKYGG